MSFTVGCCAADGFAVAGGQLLLTVEVGVTTGAFLVGMGLLQFSSETKVDLDIGVEDGASSSSYTYS